MDEEISRWILEFVVRQPVDDNLLHIMLSKLPLRPDDARLKKALLLRRIQSVVSNGSVSENVLDLLELFWNLDLSDGKAASESMKMAYCAVAVDCVVRFLDDEPEKSGDFYQAMKRIWKVRVEKIERLGDAGLISGKLLIWRDDLKAAIRDRGVCDRILSKNTRNEALKAVKGFLAYAWEDLGPSFLEKAAAEYMVGPEGNEQGGNSQRDGGNQTVETGVVDDDDARNAGKGTVSGGNDGAEKPNGEQDLPVNRVQEQEGVLDHQKGEQASEAMENAQCSIDSETQEQVEIAVRHRHVNLRGIFNAPGFAKIPDPVKTDEGNSMSKTDNVPPPEVSRLKEVSDTASKEPQHVSTSPLSNELHTSPSASKNPSTKEAHVHNADHTQQTKNDVEDGRGKKRLPECSGPAGADSSPKKRRVDSQSAPMEEDKNEKVAKGKVVDSQCPGQCVKPSLMERNPTAHTYSWEELSGTSASVSPNGPHWRRMKRRWTSVEEEALKEGVKKFGRGNWKVIKQAYRDIFQNRSEVDLKDKWRNLSKR